MIRAAAAFGAALALAATAGSAAAVDGPVVATSPALCRAQAGVPAAVTLIGDSLTVQSLEAISAAYAGAQRPLCVNAQSGRRTIDAVPYLKTLRATGQLAPTVVLALGTNDTDTPNAAFNQAAQAALGQTYPRPTGWAVGYRSTDPAGSARIAGLVGEWDAAIARVTSARWGDVVRAHPEFIGPDGVHPTELGRIAYAGFLLSATPRSAS